MSPLVLLKLCRGAARQEGRKGPWRLPGKIQLSLVVVIGPFACAGAEAGGGSWRQRESSRMGQLLHHQDASCGLMPWRVPVVASKLVGGMMFDYSFFFKPMIY